ncbi:flagellar motor switch phosphatase FliY [Natranaerobius thermophilus JW/NM-WN-LF]|uniref:CheC, inhibitor of MCP methylation / FliN fusion protein n=1 Tax=Natranaerobius thermophilus (strain ATCC BAA-1301 / DSM 18059 / JW/NM-WN-LF) TaxID=457570 RepID=B2A359_NATTJ|nr:flagellar motor switch phosphatase FliY [Natranaerobius thermophilus]ACB84989.1 CheC, inhibitor of MCP methylation / FliN fusion protein [Natranaerobius thermophilus JW/NM-WN-LF]
MENNKDILSQEEIDALLKGSGDDDSGDDGDNHGGSGGSGSGNDGNGGNGNNGDNGDNSLNETEKDTVGEIGNISMGTAATTLSVLLNQKVSITTPRVEVTDYATLREEFPKPHVAVEVEYLEGLEGINVLILKQEDAKMIANLMMGGDGTDIAEGEIEEFHLSAVGEAMNQMMGSASTSMSDMFDKTINISPPSVKMLDLGSEEALEELPKEPMIKVAFDLKIGDLIDSEIMQLIPFEFAKDMVVSLTGDSAEEVSAGQQEMAASSEGTAAAKPQAPTQTGPGPESGQSPEREVSTQGQPTGQGEQQMKQEQQPKKDYQPVEFSPLEGHQSAAKGENSNIELIMDVPLEVTVELGQTKKKIQEILELVPGSIIELDKIAGEPVDIKVNGKLIAKGEVVVIDENFGIRITEIISPVERINKLQ